MEANPSRREDSDRMHWGTVLILAFSLSGCIRHGNNPVLYNVSGKVTYLGEPVPAGQIHFEPDRDAGNSGPPGYADIVNGRFDTNSPTGRGIVAGPTIITIVGWKERPLTPGAAGKKLFDDFVIQQTFQPKENEISFDIPDLKAKPAQ